MTVAECEEIDWWKVGVMHFYTEEPYYLAQNTDLTFGQNARGWEIWEHRREMRSEYSKDPVWIPYNAYLPEEIKAVEYRT